MIPTIVLVHHGYTIFDEAPGRVQSWSMLPLNEHGLKIVGETAKQLEKIPIWHVIASRIQRTAETGKLIADHLKVTFIPTELLVPWNKGAFVGQYDSDVAKACKWFCDHPEIRVPKGESYQEYFDRWRNGWEWLKSFAEANPEKAVCAVTHSENFASLDAVETRTLGDYNKKLVPPCGGYWVIQKVNDKWLITGKSW